MHNSVTAADVLLATLADHQVQHIFLLPGGGAMHLNDALARSPSITAVPCHHEQACAIAAEAYGRTGYPGNPGFGVCMVTTGPGATNAITAVAGAWIDSVPLLIISGQVKRADRLQERPIRQGGVQEVDIVPLVQRITKYAATVDDPVEIRFHLERALYLMKNGRPGPVWIDVPLDVQAAPVRAATLPGWQTPKHDVPLETQWLPSLAALLRESRRPLILAGHGVRLAGAATEFAQLIQRWQVPAVLTWNALDLLPADHPMNMGRPGVVAARSANFAVQNCDLLIAIGSRLENVVTAYSRLGFARSARKVVVDIDPHELQDKRDMGIDLALEMDAKTFIHSLEGINSVATSADWTRACSSWKHKYPQNEGLRFASSGAITHAHFVAAFSQATPPDTLIATGSSGLAIEFFYAGFQNKSGQRCFLTSGLGAMGYGLPAAIGACLGNDRQPMLAVESDGSLQLNLQEFATLVGLALPICLFIMNNGGYASIRNTQRNYFQGRYLASGPESGLHMPDLAKLASAYGLGYTRIDDCADLTQKLVDAQHLPRPCLVEVFLVHDETLQPKCAAMPRPDGSIVSMPLEDMSPLLPLETLRAEMMVPLLPASLEATRPTAS
jgi:acetolactate synthase-1/2/3 large subunit